MIRTYMCRSVVPLLCAGLVAAAGEARAQTTISTDVTTLNFTVPSGGFATKQVNVTATNSTTIFVNTANSPTWLTVSPSGPVNLLTGSPVVLNVTANAASIASGMNLTGAFTIGIQSANGSPIPITVNLGVMGVSALSTSVPSLGFSIPAGTSANN
ncbi:MAG TPA: hypothetical protein VKS01_06775, partial [Bryobacteraceae bacterium]|nr:hypothetical protein [Bryobacteraceae bacterium]